MMNLLESWIKNFDHMDPELRKTCYDTWDKISLDVQTKKLASSMIFDQNKRSQIINGLKQRPAILAHIALSATNSGTPVQTFAEVGTAQGLQSIIFSKVIPGASIYTCDIKDDRDEGFSSHKNITFVTGNSRTLGSKLKEDNVKIDFCWVDGSHDHYAVIEDFLSLLPHTHENTIWSFDDYDARFGCYADLNLLLKHFKESVVLDLGFTASGNPNKIIISRGFQ